MHEALKGLDPVTFELAKKLRHDSERLFAVSFLSWFESWPHLYHEPFKVLVPGLGYTYPDFATELNRNDMILYEVTITMDTTHKKRKLQQQRIYQEYTGSRKHVRALEINGGALSCADTTMQMLEDMYHDRITVEGVQKNINKLGRNMEFFQATWAREAAQI